MRKLFKAITILAAVAAVSAACGLMACDSDDSDTSDSTPTSSNIVKESSNEVDANGIQYTLSDDGTYYSVTGYSGSSTTVEIPSTYENLSVTEIGFGAFGGCTSLTSVTIGNSVTYIGMDAFKNCTALTSVTIGSSVTSINNYAFYKCTALTEINFNATAMDDYNSSGHYIFAYAGQSGDGITVNIGANVTKIPDNLFAVYYKSENPYMPNITSVVFEDGSVCESIGNYAFRYCYGLKDVAIGNSVTSIGNFAFANCSSLESITIPDSVISIGSYAFKSCTSLVSVTIGSGVTSIGDYAFDYCPSLASITIPNSVTSIGYRAFAYCTVLTSVTFENTDGWYITKTSGATSGTDLDASDLADTSKAATCLTDTYRYYYLYRTKS